MYIPYKNKHDNPSNPTPVDTIDCHDIQADVLATDLSENTKITGLKQLKTDTKIPTKAINALNEQLGNAQASASDALQRARAVENRVTRLESGGADLGSTSGTVDSDLARQMMKEVKSYDAFVQGANVVEVPLTVELPSNADVESRLPTMVKNVKFYNAAKEDYVNIYWNAERYNGMVGEHVLTARYEHGYTGIAPTATVKILDQESQYPQAKHIYGMVLAQEGGNCDPTYGVGCGTWVRVNQNMEPVDFDPSHGTWAYMRPVTHPLYGEFVEIPVTFVKTETIQEGPYAGKNCWWIADGEADGFHIHPAFIGQDCKPHPLQISAYMASMKDGHNDDTPDVLDDTPVSKDNGIGYSNYGWVKKGQNGQLQNYTYNEINTRGWMSDNVRPYSIYDHHFLARMMLTEFGTPYVWGQKVDGVQWVAYNRINYHGIYDPFGGPEQWYTSSKRWENNSYLFIAGFTVCKGTYQLYATDGSLQMIETNVPCIGSHSGLIYIKNCLTTVVPGVVDFGDLFMPTTTPCTDKTQCSFRADTQITSVSTNDYCGCFKTSQTVDDSSKQTPSIMSAYGPFAFSKDSINDTMYSNCSWRITRCGE